MRLGKHNKTPNERKRYEVDYDSWLDTGETISARAFSVSPVTSPTLVVDGSANGADNRSIIFFVSGGTNGTDYTLDVQITTSGGQIKEDTILFSVRDV